MKATKVLWCTALLSVLLCNSVFGQKTHKLVSRVMENDEVRNYFYNEQGTLDSLYCLETISDWFETYTVYKYDDNGNCIKEEAWQFYNNKWTFMCYIDYKYNDKNQLIERYNYNSLATETFTLGGKITWEYNEAGNQTYVKTYLAGGNEDEFSLLAEEYYMYDEKGRLEKLEVSTLNFYAGDIILTNYVEYTYDDKDRLIETLAVDLDENGNQITSKKKTYEYDEAGNILEETSFGGSSPVSKSVYHYDTEIQRDNAILPFNIEERDNQFVMRTSPNVIIKQEWWQVPNEIDELVHVGDYIYTYEATGLANESKQPDHQNLFRLFVRDRTLFLSDVREGNQVQIFDATGALVKNTSYRSSGISLKDLPQGLYIVRSGRNAAKIIR